MLFRSTNESLEKLCKNMKDKIAEQEKIVKTNQYELKGQLQDFYQVLFQKLPDVVVPEQYFIPQGRIGDDAGGTIVLQGSLGDAQSLADLLGRKPRTVVGWTEREWSAAIRSRRR